MPTVDEIKTVIEGDPDGIGLSWALSNDEIVDAFGARHSVITDAESISVNDIVLSIIPAFSRLATASNAMKEKWTILMRPLDMVAGDIRVSDPRVGALLDALVSDGLLSQSERDGVGRVGTYAEWKFGAGSQVSIADIRTARSL